MYGWAIQCRHVTLDASLSPMQTPAAWTLREFHEKGAATNFKQPSSLTYETPLNPPPVPARRLASHPPVPTTANNKPSPPPERSSESHSAPSSPTGEQRRLAIPTETSPSSSRNSSGVTVSPRTSPSARPRSMMIEATAKELAYSTVKFTDSLNQKPYHKSQRRDTKYSEIAHVIRQPNTEEALKTNVPVPTPRSRSLDRREHPRPLVNHREDLPLPPVPVTLVEKNRNQQTSPSNNIHSQPFEVEDPFANNPFDNDPFADNADEWQDSTAFYDRPPPPRPYTAGMEVPKPATPEPKIVPDNLLGETADCTDESAYQDTKDFLKGMQAKHRGEELQVTPQTHEDDAIFVPLSDVFMPELNTSEPPPPVPEPETKQSPTAKLTGAYEYPCVLDRYPKKPDESQPHDEPLLHTMTYSKPVPGVSGGLTRHESLRGSGRRGVPLPPLPPLPDKEQPPPPVATGLPAGLSSPPPLPARPAIGTPGYQAPALPPFNHPWGNKKARSEEQQPNPPLPPRRKEPAPSYNGGTEAPLIADTAPEKPSAVTELLALGYTLSEIERALLIANNELTLAKLILKEFGGRN